jgi:hypothetical protein
MKSLNRCWWKATMDSNNESRACQRMNAFGFARQSSVWFNGTKRGANPPKQPSGSKSWTTWTKPPLRKNPLRNSRGQPAHLRSDLVSNFEIRN